jgi:hypothetical protein
MTETIIKAVQGSKAYYGEEWLMTGSLLTKYEFDKAFKLAKHLGFIPFDEFWQSVSIAVVADKQVVSSKYEVSVSGLVNDQLQLICEAFQKSGDPQLEEFISGFESKLENVATHPFSFPACINYPSNEKIKSVRYIVCGDYRIVYQANKYFVNIAFVTHSTRCKKLLKDNFQNW